MKTIAKLLSIVITVTLFLCSCDNNEEPSNSCIEGNVFAFLECGEGALIQIKNQSDLGGKLTYKDVEYENVVQVPGSFPHGVIYFNYRAYDKENDKHLFESDELCQWLYGPYDVPIIVISNHSQTKCPNKDEK
jgi:hypothetical protein